MGLPGLLDGGEGNDEADDDDDGIASFKMRDD